MVKEFPPSVVDKLQGPFLLKFLRHNLKAHERWTYPSFLGTDLERHQSSSPIQSQLGPKGIDRTRI